MPTIDNKSIIDKLIANNGFYPQEPDDECSPDPQVFMIVEYTNAYGNVTWGVTWINEHPESRMRYLVKSQYIINPKVIWQVPMSTSKVPIICKGN